jgi:hypothetical protein
MLCNASTLKSCTITESRRFGDHWGEFLFRIDWAHEADCVAIGIINHRVSGTEERVVGCESALVTGSDQRLVGVIDFRS